MGRWRHGLLKAPEPGGLVSGLSLLQQRPLWPVPRQPGPPAWGGRVHLAETHGALPTPAGAHREAPALWALVCPGDRSSYCPGQGTQTLQLSQHHRGRQWCLQAKVGTLTGEQWGVLGWFPEHGVPEPGMWVTVENWASGAAATLPSPRTLFLRGPTFGKHPPRLQRTVLGQPPCGISPCSASRPGRRTRQDSSDRSREHGDPRAAGLSHLGREKFVGPSAGGLVDPFESGDGPQASALDCMTPF